MTEARALAVFGALTGLIALANAAPLLGEVDLRDPAAGAWSLSTLCTHAALYTLPAVLPPLLLDLAGLRRAALAAAPALGAAVQLLLFADVFVFRRFGFHLNGFVWNLVTTPGGLESMGSDGAAERTVAALAAGFLALEVAALLLARRLARAGAPLALRPRPRAAALALAALACVDVAARIAYGYASLRGYGPVVSAAEAFPLYVPLTFRAAARRLGIRPAESPTHAIRAGEGRLDYPKRPLHVRPDAPRPSIVWVACESLRADALAPDVMPRTWAFAESACRFTEHVSGGNGTRMGLFSMFYGLYGSYWFSFLAEGRDPVLFDVLRERGYRVQAQTSALFSYPEFDRTVFASLPRERLLERPRLEPGYVLDRITVDRVLAFVDEGRGAGGPAREPFMAFAFLESAHARYHFPPEDVIRPDYLEDVNYVTLDPARDGPRLKNRYLNAVHALDRELGRLYDGLASRGLLDSTIVIVTGDHGEEFMEKGRWGHNSAFSEEQIRTPLVIRIPGRAPGVESRPTSHLDLAPTVLAALGVDSPPGDYALGRDLFGPERPPYAVLADWDSIAFRDEEWKAVFSLEAGGVGRRPRITTTGDLPVSDEGAFTAARGARLREVMRDLGAFRR